MLKGTTVRVRLRRCHSLFILRSTASGIAVCDHYPVVRVWPPPARAPMVRLGQGNASWAVPADIYLQPIFILSEGMLLLVPAAFMFILQQILLIGASIFPWSHWGSHTGSAFSTVLGRGVARLTAILPALAFLLHRAPRSMAFPTLGQPRSCSRSPPCFLFATSFMGQAAGA